MDDGQSVQFFDQPVKFFDESVQLFANYGATGRGGASITACNNFKMFESITDWKPIQKVRTANQEYVPVIAIGTIRLKLTNASGISESFLLQNVCYIPSFAHNLLSIKQLARDHDIKTVFGRRSYFRTPSRNRFYIHEEGNSYAFEANYTALDKHEIYHKTFMHAGKDAYPDSYPSSEIMFMIESNAVHVRRVVLKQNRSENVKRPFILILDNGHLISVDHSQCPLMDTHMLSCFMTDAQNTLLSILSKTKLKNLSCKHSEISSRNMKISYPTESQNSIQIMDLSMLTQIWRNSAKNYVLLERTQFLSHPNLILIQREPGDHFLEKLGQPLWTQMCLMYSGHTACHRQLWSVQLSLERKGSLPIKWPGANHLMIKPCMSGGAKCIISCLSMRDHLSWLQEHWMQFTWAQILRGTGMS